MIRQIKFEVLNSYQLDIRIVHFFENYGFQLIETKEDFLKFRQKSSLLDGWKTNPLKWGSEVSILLSDKTIVADFIVDTDGQMNTKEEKKVWQTFIQIFRHFLINGQTENLRLLSAISENKKSRLYYFGWAIIGALTGGLLFLLYAKLMNYNSPFKFLIIPIMTTIFLVCRIQYLKNKNAI